MTNIVLTIIDATRLVGLAGNVALAKFGLGDDEYRNLALETGIIFHSAAWVNMALPYPSYLLYFLFSC